MTATNGVLIAAGWRRRQLDTMIRWQFTRDTKNARLIAHATKNAQIIVQITKNTDLIAEVSLSRAFDNTASLIPQT
jgi:hypothetical protein